MSSPEAREVIVTTLDEIELRGRAQMLLELLRARFGPVPAKVSAKVQAADEATLSRWAVRVLTAPSLKDVLADNGRKTSPALERKVARKGKAVRAGATGSRARPART
jgi:hypothetical protein